MHRRRFGSWMSECDAMQCNLSEGIRHDFHLDAIIQNVGSVEETGVPEMPCQNFPIVIQASDRHAVVGQGLVHGLSTSTLAQIISNRLEHR